MGNAHVISKEDLILYVLSKLPPDKSDKYFINKLAFMIEFSYIHKNSGKPLSDANYAAIPHGPVIDQYASIFAEMQDKGLIKLSESDDFVRLVTTDSVQ